MGFLKTLFGGREESPEEKAEKRREREFDVLKYDGVRARKIGEVKYAIRCFREALALRNDTETASYLAEALLSDKQAEEARSILAKLAEELPDHIGVRLAMARADEMMQDYTRMDEDCRANRQRPCRSALPLGPSQTCLARRAERRGSIDTGHRAGRTFDGSLPVAG